MVGNARLAHAEIRVEDRHQPRPFDLRESLGLAQGVVGLLQALVAGQGPLDDAVEFGTTEAAPPVVGRPARVRPWRAGPRQGAVHRRSLDELRAFVRRRFRAAADKQKKPGRGRDG